MSAPINDGGPAFPCGYHPDGNSADQGGMSLRDWFAGQALVGVMASHRPGDDWPAKAAARQGVEPQDVIAAGAYDIADAMLKARKEAQS